VEDFPVGDRTIHSIEGRGVAGQFICMFPELDLVSMVTAQDRGMEFMLRTLPQRIIATFTAG